MSEISTQKNAIHSPTFDQAELGIVLDFCAQPILFIDETFRVYYVNFRALSFFHTHLDQFKACDQTFDPNVLYTNFKFLNEKLSHRHDEMTASRLGECLTEVITVNALTLELRMIPIFSTNYERLGMCIEIHDKTELVHLATSLENAIQAAERGVFDEKVTEPAISQKYQAFQPIHQKLNTLFEKIHVFFGEITCALEHLVNGNLTQDVIFQEDGANQSNIFDSTKHDFNYAFKQLYTLIKHYKDDILLVQLVFEKITKNHMLLHSINENQMIETQKIGTHFSDFFDQVRANALETQQALEVANTLTHNYEAIDSLRHVFNDIRHQLQAVLESTKYMHYVFKGNLDNLKIALYEIEKGNIGKGIAIVTQECEQMIARTNSLMYQIQTLVANINQNFDEKHQILESFSFSINGMMDIISLMSSLLTQIQKNILNQDSLFTHVNQSVTQLKEEQNLTTTTLVQTERLSQALVSVNHNAEHSLKAFSQSLAVTPEEKEKMTQRLDTFLE